MMKKTAVPSILSFKKIPFIFLAILIFCHSSIIYAGENEQYCKDLLSNIIIKKVAINKDKNEKAIKSFWQNKNGTFLGARYYKISKKVAKKVKIMFMDINSNFRPIYYIENDEASYPKIFKYIELINAKDNSNEMSSLKKEINDWIAKYKSYDKEMENLILEYSTLAAYTQKLKELKNNSFTNYPFEIQILLSKDGKDQTYKDYVGSPEDINHIILKLNGKMKNLKGTSFFRFGAIDDREFNQALLKERLRSLESEIRNFLASSPGSEENFKEVLNELIVLNRDPKYAPTLRFATKLEFREMNSEYRDLFKTAEIDYTKLDELSKKIIEDLSPRYQEKLGLKAAKNWVTAMKAGRMGVVVAGVGSLGTGLGAMAIRLWNWLNYEEDSKYNIINAKDEDEFDTNIKTYLKGKYPIDLITRIERKNDNEMTLKNYNPKKKLDVEIIEFINGVIVERKKFIHEEKLLSDLEENLGKIIEDIRTKSDQEKSVEDSSPQVPSEELPKEQKQGPSSAKPTKSSKIDGQKKPKDKNKKNPKKNDQLIPSPASEY